MAKSSGPAKTVHERTTGEEREKMIDATTAEIIKKFGSGSIMKFGDDGHDMEIEAIPTGALALDAALGIGGVPRGRIVEIYGPESSGKTTLSRSRSSPRRRALGGVVAFIDAEHALDPSYASRIGVDIDEVLISQPDTGEQAARDLRHARALRRHRCHRHRLGGRARPQGGDRGRDWRQLGRPPGAPHEPGPCASSRDPSPNPTPPVSSSTSCARRSA